LINATYYWYTTATGGSPVFSGISYTPDFTVSGTHYFYVSETRPGCTDESGRTPVQVVVHPYYSNPDISIENTTN
ncbi:immunoglobulin domain-containing protein, partial [Sinomicrobium weinanense]